MFLHNNNPTLSAILSSFAVFLLVYTLLSIMKTIKKKKYNPKGKIESKLIEYKNSQKYSGIISLINVSYNLIAIYSLL